VHTCLYSHPTLMIFILNYLKGENKAYEIYENLNKKIALTSYLNHS
jgi:hypothetical protein